MMIFQKLGKLCTINIQAVSATFPHVKTRASSIMYDQQFLQHPRQQMLPSPLQTQQQLQQRTNTTTPVSIDLGYAALVLRDQPSPSHPSDYCCSDSVFECYYYVPLSSCVIINDQLIK